MLWLDLLPEEPKMRRENSERGAASAGMSVYTEVAEVSSSGRTVRIESMVPAWRWVSQSYAVAVLCDMQSFVVRRIVSIITSSALNTSRAASTPEREPSHISSRGLFGRTRRWKLWEPPGPVFSAEALAGGAG